MKNRRFSVIKIHLFHSRLEVCVHKTIMSTLTVQPKKVLRNGKIMKPLIIEDSLLNFSDTSPYDSFTEIVSYAIQRCQYVREYFENNRDPVKDIWHNCYATTVLNFAKYGPHSDSYQFRGTFLKGISFRRTALFENPIGCFVHSPLIALTELLREYKDVNRDKPCDECFYSKWTLSYVEGAMHTDSHRNIPATFQYLKNIINEYFKHKNFMCKHCKHKQITLQQTLPLLSISREKFHAYKPQQWFLAFADFDKTHVLSEISVDKLPSKFTMDRCVYVLCGVIGRTSSTENRSNSHYTAYCRASDGTWDKRDSLNEDVENLAYPPNIQIAQIFYANLGRWDATERKLLLEPAKWSWYREIKIQLPDLCVEKILSYLDYGELELLINGETMDEFARTE